MRRERRLLVVFAIVASVLVYFTLFTGKESTQSSLTHSRHYPDGTDSSSPRQHKITFIVPWQSRGSGTPNYLPYFFQSVEANPQVDLLFVHIDVEQRGCSFFWNATNVQEICLTESQYYQLHVDYLCGRWNCTTDQKTMLTQYLVKQGQLDVNKTFFRIFRNRIFERWIDPSTTIWGWCDPDIVWGNFKRRFPWDIAHEFDIIAIASQPDFSEQRLLFTRGHMAFLKNTPQVTQKLFTFTRFKSLSSFLLAPPSPVDAEESEFSHFYFYESNDFTFIQLEGMVNSYDASLFSSSGTFYVPLSKDRLTPQTRQRLLPLIRPQNKAFMPTFSEGGRDTQVELRPGSEYKGGLWFDAHYAQFVEPDWTREEREQKAFILRRAPGGPVTVRWEPRTPFLAHDGDLAVDECLYKHFQEEKRRPWFKRLPPRGLAPGQIFYQIGADEAQIWDEKGRTVHETGTDGLTQRDYLGRPSNG